MGDLLFYLLKSGCYLIIFYLLFKLLMSGTTFFRFNRVTILAGIIGCMFLPLIEFTTQEETFLTVPLQTIQGIFVEQADGIFGDTMFWVRPQVDETGNMQAINWCPIALGYVYLAGGLFVLCRILLSFYRMFQLIRNGKRRSYGKYKLIVVSEPISSFCWGKYIVVSVSDYSQQSTDGILLHETMHLRYRHTLDLLCMQCLLILYWFNPAIWLLKRELQEVHEFEADNGVLNTGIDATRYQLLLVKKAVGTRLYSMANGFNHSKLKNRITMMLKERTNGWARLKLLLFVPVMAGTFYAFARPEVKETFVQTVPGLHQKQAMDYQTLSKLLRNEEEAYNLRKFGKKVAPTTPENRMNQLLMNARNVMLFDGDYVLKENLKDKVKEKLLYKQRREKEKSGRKDEQIVGFWCDRGTNVDEARQALQAVYDAYTEIRDSIAIASGNDSKDFLDKEFPIVVSQYENLKKFGSQSGDCLSGIELNFMSGKDLLKELKNPTAEELQQAVTDYREKLKDGRKLSVRVKVDRECNMGTVLKMKQILRENW